MRAVTSSVNLRRAGQVAVDGCLLTAAYYLAYVLRFDSGIPHRYDELLGDTIVFVVAMKLVVFALFGLYSKLWRFVDQKDFEAIVKAAVVSSVALIAGLFVIALDFLIALALVTGTRFLVRAAVERPMRAPLIERAARDVLIVGAGNGGQ